MNRVRNLILFTGLLSISALNTSAQSPEHSTAGRNIIRNESGEVTRIEICELRPTSTVQYEALESRETELTLTVNDLKGQISGASKCKARRLGKKLVKYEKELEGVQRTMTTYPESMTNPDYETPVVADVVFEREFAVRVESKKSESDPFSGRISSDNELERTYREYLRRSGTTSIPRTTPEVEFTEEERESISSTEGVASSESGVIASEVGVTTSEAGVIASEVGVIASEAGVIASKDVSVSVDKEAVYRVIFAIVEKELPTSELRGLGDVAKQVLPTKQIVYYQGNYPSEAAATRACETIISQGKYLDAFVVATKI
ncbi:MAG: hypothetical protein R3Y61_03650 [Rikenellaceae bacterium]